MPQLDSLRALAFFGVAASHWVPGNPLAFAGGTGVQLFFVLSGFLITGILLEYRRLQESDASLTARAALRTFYIRRFFRIFPLYYGVIAATLILNIGPIRELWPWHVCYASNFLYGLHKPGPDDPFTHFWSLGVEEQFYLIWPFLIFFLRPITLQRLIITLILIAPLCRIGMEMAFPELHRVNYFPISCGDSLGLGACLAVATRDGFFGASGSQVARRIGILGLLGALASAALIPVAGNALAVQMGHTFVVLFFGWLVFGAAQGFGGWFGALLNRPELRFLGKISYGLYVFHHFFTLSHVRTFLGLLGLPPEWSEHVVVQFVVRLFFTVLLAAISWYLYEKPLNNLKRHFTIAKELKESHNKAIEGVAEGARS
jgi:peptidoglycan/LPS O-acetylase OafA/YrhL